MKRLNLRCQCGYLPHQIEFVYDEEGFFTVTMLTSVGNLLERAKTAFRLLFGEPQGCAEVVLTDESVKQLKAWLEEIPDEFGLAKQPLEDPF